MYELLRNLGWQRLLTEQGPSMLIAWLIAEFFYKFHSFTLECAAFLATWFALDLVLATMVPARRRSE
jgi:hypothetical protein